jgi:hypothetical protein
MSKEITSADGKRIGYLASPMFVTLGSARYS